MIRYCHCHCQSQLPRFLVTPRASRASRFKVAAPSSQLPRFPRFPKGSQLPASSFQPQTPSSQGSSFPTAPYHTITLRQYTTPQILFNSPTFFLSRRILAIMYSISQIPYPKFPISHIPNLHACFHFFVLFCFFRGMVERVWLKGYLKGI